MSYDGSQPKRMRTDYNGQHNTSQGSYASDVTNCLFVNGIPSDVIEIDVIDGLSNYHRFGRVVNVQLMLMKAQAIVEFDDPRAVQEICQQQGLIISETPVGVQPTTMTPSGEKINNVLLVTIQNPNYPITPEVLQKISQPHGDVQRVVIFNKNGVQAMIEFDTKESAQRAKAHLNGADVYSGCCTLNIKYAKPTRLNVYKNDNETFDFTQDCNQGRAPAREKTALLSAPPQPVHSMQNNMFPAADRGYGDASMSDRGIGHRGGRPYEDSVYSGGYGGQPPMSMDPYRGMPGNVGRSPDQGTAGFMRGPSQNEGRVLIMYNLKNKAWGPDSLFNLICLYGNVVRIFFMKSKPGNCFVEMGSGEYVQNIISFLKDITAFGDKLECGLSSQPTIQPKARQWEMDNGLDSYKDYSNSRNNRYTSRERALKNRPMSPNKVVHFFNLPKEIREPELRQIFVNAESPEPVVVTYFETKSERGSVTGLLEFASSSDAIEAMVLCNHAPIDLPNQKSGFPQMLKMCFSRDREVKPKRDQND